MGCWTVGHCPHPLLQLALFDPLAEAIRCGLGAPGSGRDPKKEAHHRSPPCVFRTRPRSVQLGKESRPARAPWLPPRCHHARLEQSARAFWSGNVGPREARSSILPGSNMVPWMARKGPTVFLYKQGDSTSRSRQCNTSILCRSIVSSVPLSIRFYRCVWWFLFAVFSMVEDWFCFRDHEGIV